MGYKEDLRLEEKFKNTIKKILGLYFIFQDKIADQKEGTDFLTFVMKPFRIGLRLRTFGYFKKYSRQFTIRWSRPSGIETEIDKINRGYVNYLFYGFVDEEEKNLIQYFIADFDVFKLYEIKPRYIFKNNPYDSKLAVYYLDDFPQEFILKFWPKESY